MTRHIVPDSRNTCGTARRAKRSISWRCRPNSLTRRAPPMLSVSFIMAFICALVSIWLRARSRSEPPRCTEENGEGESGGPERSGGGSKPLAANSSLSPKSEETPSEGAGSVCGEVRERWSKACVASSSSSSLGSASEPPAEMPEAIGAGGGFLTGVNTAGATAADTTGITPRESAGGGGSVLPRGALGGSEPLARCGRRMMTFAHFLQRTFTPLGPIFSSAIMY